METHFLKTVYPQGDFDADHILEGSHSFITEFTLKSHKLVTEMHDFVGNESELWRKYYSDVYGINPKTPGTNNFFDEDDVEFYNGDVMISEWEWTHENKTYILLDIYAYPGDNQSGAIFLDGVLILTNSDQSLSSTVNTPLPFQNESRMQTLAHIRTIINNDETCDGGDSSHDLCKKIKEKSFEMDSEII